MGRPNVGKSSLFDRLVERERAIVTATPGTTRDLVTETVSIGGIPVKLVDTAGIRQALDEAESIGIRKSLEALAEADLVLVVLDASETGGEEEESLLAQASKGAVIVVENKADLVAQGKVSWTKIRPMEFTWNTFALRPSRAKASANCGKKFSRKSGETVCNANRGF